MNTLAAVTVGEGAPFALQEVELWRQARCPIERIMREYPFADIERAAADAERGDVI